MKRFLLSCRSFGLLLKLEKLLSRFQKSLDVSLLKKIRLLLHPLKTLPLGSSSMSLISAAATLIMSYGNLSAQQFNPPVFNPFGISNGYTYAFPAFVDIDGDGDLDLFVGELYESNPYTNVLYFENTGTANAPSFYLAGKNPFGIIFTYSYVFAPAFADLDNDGDYDLLAGGYYYGTLLYFQNTGTNTAPSFAGPVINPFGIVVDSLSNYSNPAFADLDNDGDMDLMIGDGFGYFQYFENTGTPSQPAFAQPLINPFGLTQLNGTYVYPAFVDIDGDGDLDLFSGEDYFPTTARFVYFENTGTPSSPSFAAPAYNPFGLQNTDYYCMPTFADIDGDGDFDAFAGMDNGYIAYFENIATGIMEQAPTKSIRITPNPARSACLISIPAVQNRETLFSITDAVGKKLFETKLNMHQTTVHLDTEALGLKSGIYTISITSSSQQFKSKLLIAQ